jgi:hypothetical protein
MNKKAGKIEHWVVGVAVAAAAIGFGYWLTAPCRRAPAASVASNVASGQAEVLMPQPQVTEPTGPPPTVAPDSAGGLDRTYAPPTGQPSNGH